MRGLKLQHEVLECDRTFNIEGLMLDLEQKCRGLNFLCHHGSIVVHRLFSISFTVRMLKESENTINIICSLRLIITYAE